jgi:hypothetical protein
MQAAIPLTPSNIDTDRVYLYRSINTAYGVILEQKIRVVMRGTASVLCHILQHRVYRAGSDDIPDWCPTPASLPKRLPLHHDEDDVSVWEV